MLLLIAKHLFANIFKVFVYLTVFSNVSKVYIDFPHGKHRWHPCRIPIPVALPAIAQ